MSAGGTNLDVGWNVFGNAEFGTLNAKLVRASLA